MKLSLIVPCYNEAENVAAFQNAVITAFDGCGYDYEIVFVNDGSRDATLHQLKKLHAAQKCPVKVVSFARNFGKDAGIYAGLEHASGEMMCVIDADLQQRPEIVRDMVRILDEKPECDMVAAYQDRRGEGKVLSFFKKSFYAVINRLSSVSCGRTPAISAPSAAAWQRVFCSCRNATASPRAFLPGWALKRSLSPTPPASATPAPPSGTSGS